MQVGGFAGTGNVSIQNNQCIGKDLKVPTNSTYMTYGITFAGLKGGLISGNYLQGCGQGCLNGYFSRWVAVTGNYLLESGNGGNAAMYLQSNSDSVFKDNIVKTAYPDGSQNPHSLAIQEVESTGLVNTNGTTVNALSGFPITASIKGQGITINAVNYTITAVTPGSNFTINTTAGIQTNVAIKTRYSNNKYIHNDVDAVNLAAGSASVVTPIGGAGAVGGSGGGLDAAGVRAVNLTGLGTGSAAPIAAADTLLEAAAKTKFQLANPNPNFYKGNGEEVIAYDGGSNRYIVGSAAIRTDFYSSGSLMLFRLAGGVNAFLSPADYRLPANYGFNFADTAGNATANPDVGLARESAGILKITNDTTGWAAKFCFNALGTVCDFAGTGAPESVVTAAVGSTYRRTDGGAGTSFYVKETGANTNTGWAAK